MILIEREGNTRQKRFILALWLRSWWPPVDKGIDYLVAE